MRILVADDDVSIRRLLTSLLSDWGFQVVAAEDGSQAWAILLEPDAPPAAILDWNMPGLSGPEVIKQARGLARDYTPYLLLLTAKDKKADIVEGLRAGASDYIVKPFDYDELQSRLHIGVENVRLQMELGLKIRELRNALDQVTSLQELLPICSYCRKVRDDQHYWQNVETYLTVNSGTKFSHSVCPDCYQSVVIPQLEQMRRGKV